MVNTDGAKVRPDARPEMSSAAAKVAHIISEVLQPPLVVAVMLLVSPAGDDGFPGTFWFGAVALFFVCGLPFAAVLWLVKLGKITDHHVSNRKQRAPVLMMTAVSVFAGLMVLMSLGAPASVLAMVLAIVGGIVVLAAVSLFWKMSGHASAIACSAVIGAQMLGPAGLLLLLVIPVVGWSRVALGAHSLSQVVAGSLFGGIVMAGAWSFLRWSM
jgi:membrane-associated phospholipid phosphatase